MGCFETLQPRPDASIASPILAGGRSRTAPRPCQGVARTENIESEAVSPAGILPSLGAVAPPDAGPVAATAQPRKGMRKYRAARPRSELAPDSHAFSFVQGLANNERREPCNSLGADGTWVGG